MVTVIAPERVLRRVRLQRWVLAPLRPAIVLGVVGGTIGWLGSWNPSYWGDEAASVMSAERPLPSLFAELGRVDAVHGLYYFFLHFWIRLFGASELATRAPSAVAVAVLIAGIVVLGYRLSGARVGIVAGLVAIAVPRIGFLPTEARSYAMSTALAVWITVLFVRLWRARTVRRWEWALYGLALGLSAYLFLYLILLGLAHGATLSLSRGGRRRLRGWAVGMLIAVVAASPIAVLAYSEKHQLAFLAHRGYATVSNVLVTQWFGAAPITAAAWSFIGIALAVALVLVIARRRVPDCRATLLALCWLVLPTVALLIGDRISPMYSARYLSFSAPAAALLIALGMIRLGEMVSAGARSARLRRVPLAAPVLVLVALFAVLAVPGYLTQRGPYAKDDGSDLRQTAQYLASVADPGDAVVFDREVRASRKPRLGLHLYPADYAGLRDVGLATPYQDRPGLWDVVAPVSAVAAHLGSQVWAVELPAAGSTSADVSQLRAAGYIPTSEHRVHRTVVYGFTKENL